MVCVCVYAHAPVPISAYLDAQCVRAWHERSSVGFGQRSRNRSNRSKARFEAWMFSPPTGIIVVPGWLEVVTGRRQ